MDWLRAIPESRLLYHTLTAAGIVAVFFLASRSVRALLGVIGHRIVVRTKTILDDRVLGVILDHVRPMMLIIGLLLAIHEIQKGVLPSEQTFHEILDYCGGILYVVLILLIVKIFFGIIREGIDWYLDKVSAEGASNLKATLGPLTSKLIDILVLFVAVILILDHFGINIGSLLVSLGVGSLAVALAAQDTLANMIAGFVILVDRPFRVGDRVELATGQVGDVREIGLRSTKVLNFDNNTIIIPNAELVKSRLINYSYPNLPMRVSLGFEVQFGTDPSNVRRILLDLAGRQPGLLKDPPPRVDLTGMTPMSIQLTFSAQCVEYTQQFDIETTLREQAYRAFGEAGIEVPIQQTIVHTRIDE